MASVELGKRLRAARVERGWTQERLGELAGFPKKRCGISVNDIERGRVKEPRHERVAAMAAILVVPVEWLYGAGGARVPKPKRRAA